MYNKDIRELFDKTAEGDEESFKILYDSYFEPLSTFSELFVKSRDISLEVVSDVFFHLWTTRKKLKKVNSPKAFLYTAIKNKSLDYLRSKHHKQTQMENVNIYEIEIIDEDFLDKYESEDIKNALQAEINELPERCRMILKMYINDELKIKEISEILSIAPKTVENQLSIAQKKLKHIFKDYHSKY